jgi:hypothetical protein
LRPRGLGSRNGGGNTNIYQQARPLLVGLLVASSFGGSRGIEVDQVLLDEPLLLIRESFWIPLGHIAASMRMKKKPGAIAPGSA